MTVAQRIGALEKNLELARQAGEFVSLVRVLLQAKGDLYQARAIIEQQRVSARVRDLLNCDQALTIIRGGSGPKLGARGNASDAWMAQKAASSALSLLANSALSDYRLLVSGFVNALQSVGVFDGLLPSMRQVPISTTVGSVSVAAAGFVVGEGSAKPVSRLSLTSGALADAPMFAPASRMKGALPPAFLCAR
jgi:hypothetical protein